MLNLPEEGVRTGVVPMDVDETPATAADGEVTSQDSAIGNTISHLPVSIADFCAWLRRCVNKHSYN